MHDGDFALSHDKEMALVCSERRESGILADIEFKVCSSGGTGIPLLAVSVRAEFASQGLSVDPLLCSFGVVWAGGSKGFYTIATPADCPNSSAVILYFDLGGNCRRVTSQAFLSEGKIVGSIPGTDLVVIQTLEVSSDTGLFRTRIGVADADGRRELTLDDPNGRNCLFEDASDEGYLVYAVWPDRIYISTLQGGAGSLIGVGACPRFRPRGDPAGDASVAFASE
jgi:hypothetical protein